MDKLGLLILAAICTFLLGCAQFGQTSTSSQTQPIQQPDKTGSDGGRGGMH